MVKLDDPEAIMFIRLPDDTMNEDEVDSIADMLPVSSPADTAVCRLPATDDPPRHDRELSDVQRVASHPVPSASLDPALQRVSPKSAPSKVTQAEPLATPFPRATALTTLLSEEWLALVLPALAPTVSLVLRLAVIPSPTDARIVVSDSHVVRSHADAPPDAAAEMPASPSPAPCRVTLADPVDPRFHAACNDTLATSIETAPDKLPRALPAVTNKRLLPDAPSHILLRNDVSLSHTVCSLAVPPDETGTLSIEGPTLDP